MAKISNPKAVGNASTAQKGADQGSWERAFSIVSTCVQDFRGLTDSISSVGETIDRRKSTDTDNAVKVSKAETDAKKEGNRHAEEMARIELEYKKISEAKENGELRWSMIQEIFQMFKADYEKIVEMDTEEYKSLEIQQTLTNLRKTLQDLSVEIIRAR